MSQSEIRNPGNPVHKALITPHDGLVTVRSGNEELAKSTSAIVVVESGPHGAYPPVIYIPRGDTSDQLVPVEGKSTHCPLKGDASYFSFDGQEVAWTYDRPIPGSEQLAGYVAFYGNKVQISET